MVRVLVVEDSPTVRTFLVEVLNRAPGILVVGTAADGEEALAAVDRLNPDLVTMDIVMPRMDGLAATRRLMESHPLPIVIVSANLPTAEAEASFSALKAGALAVVARPGALSDPTHSDTAKHLVRMVKLMAEVKVVRRWPRPATAKTLETAGAPSALPGRPPAPAIPAVERQLRTEVVGIGGSTGAPVVIESILAGLPKNFSLPILVVQHIAPGFVDGFAQWLQRSTGLPTSVARDGEPLRPGHVYVAPDGFQMGVNRASQITLADAPPENGHRPAVSFLFRSLAQWFGARAAGVLLSGMGTDGAEALLLLRQQGALTIAQDPESSVVYGMPAEAVRLGAAAHSLAPEGIAILLSRLHASPGRPQAGPNSQ